MLSPLALQEVPVQVVVGLRSLAQFLPEHLTSTLGNFDRMLQAKLKPAQAFCNLLDRLIRANESGVNAGKILVDPIETRKMREDWSRFINPKAIVMREVPCGGAETEKILREDVINLLSIDEYSDEFDVGIKAEGENEAFKRNSTFGTNNDLRNTGQPGDASQAETNTFSRSEVIVLKWAQYLNSLPLRFPHVPARLFLLCMSGLLTASLREISMNGGEGFGAWWVVRCWIDEWMGWSAEMGGFLAMNEDEHKPRLDGQHFDSRAKNSQQNQADKADRPITVQAENFGQDLAFDGLVDGTSTESLLTGQGSTRLVFPDQGRSNAAESTTNEQATSSKSTRKNNEQAEEGYEFITTEEDDKTGKESNETAVADIDTGKNETDHDNEHQATGNDAEESFTLRVSDDEASAVGEQIIQDGENNLDDSTSTAAVSSFTNGPR